MWRRLGAVALMAVLTGCGGGADSEASQAECAPQVRFEGRLYTEVGHSSAPVARLGMADEAVCDDIGYDARGSHFPEDPPRVEVWTFDGYSSPRVIGVRSGELTGVYVSDSLDPETASRIAADLESPMTWSPPTG